uniref:poly(ADP-ribose) glycohydrolase n=1 Tax=Bracon brevicornis TaxID=1563983 RepID=A0A6V7LA66_9HYME
MTSSPGGCDEPEPTEDSPEWKGMSLSEVHKGSGPFSHPQQPPICPSESHTVLFHLPLRNRGPPWSYPTQSVDKWNVGYVRMPNSSHSLYPIKSDEKRPREFRMRWEVIQESLLQSFVSTAQLEAAILSYNHNYADRWDFSALHHCFSEIFEEEECEMFFKHLLPKMIQLALQLPTLITGPIPLLKKHTNFSISMSQLQVASLLANAFFCTFPRRNSLNPQSEYAAFPHINFNRLFACYKENEPNRSAAVTEKLKCLFHYFRRVTMSPPEGTITIQRRYIPPKNCPRWDKLNIPLPPLHITSKGTIETEGAGLLQVDFANKYIGGGVLNWGCVQEEIRFVICPELMVTMLVSEMLDDTEALVVTGAERYSKYEGYSHTFKWTGDYVDETPRDSSGRRETSIVAIDALYFSQADAQFSMKNINRELNKAYVGFSPHPEIEKNQLAAIATGNWGCGAFRGNPQLKVLIQLMASAVAGRSMVYFTFGDAHLRDSVAQMYWHLVDRDINIGRLYALLRQYNLEAITNHSDFYRFLFNRSKIKPLTQYFNTVKSKSRVTSPETIRRMIEDYPSDNENLGEETLEAGATKEKKKQSDDDSMEFDSITNEKTELLEGREPITLDKQVMGNEDEIHDDNGESTTKKSALGILVSSKNVTCLSKIDIAKSPIKNLKSPKKSLVKIGKDQRKISDFFVQKPF